MNEELQELMQSNPEWYKDLQYQDVKVYIKDNINSASRSFVAIGYYLKYVRDNQLFKEDGYSGISEFAKAEFGISPAQASKFMSINDRFSVDGNSPILLEQYKDFSSSKLSEMLYLTDEQLGQVTVATTNVEIREIKNGNSFSVPKTEDTPKHELPRCQHEAGTECNMINIKPIAESLGADCNGKCCWGCKELCGARCNTSAHRPAEPEAIEITEDEAAVQDMVASVKTEKSMDKYPAKKKQKKSPYPENMTKELVYKMYVGESMTAKQIAEHFGIKHTQVNAFLNTHKLFRGSYDKVGKKPVDNATPEPLPLRAQNDTEKCRVCGKEILFSAKMTREMWPYKYKRKQNGIERMMYGCNREHYYAGKTKDA